MDVHVICCNDMIERAVIADEGKAKSALERLRSNHYDRHRWQYPDFEHYTQVFYWHIHTVPAEE
ncbi:MAG: hypothetical protein AzoDbin1_04749 [Azoarcus sp.]|nr:hypothetical protein [Azoarcus sp.]